MDRTVGRDRFGGRRRIPVAAVHGQLLASAAVALLLFSESADAQTPNQGAGAPPDTSPVIRTHIDKVSFSNGLGSDAGPPSISVMASYGKKQMTGEEIKACMDEHWEVLPSVKAHQIDFLYDGNGYRPTPATLDIAKIFESR